MVAPLFGDEADQDREVVEAVVPVMLSDPGVVGAVATETVMVAVVVPLPFTAVKVYRVVVERAGVVVLLPVTVPILGLMGKGGGGGPGRPKSVASPVASHTGG